MLEALRLALDRGLQLFIYSIDAEILYLSMTEPGNFPSLEILTSIAIITALTSQLPNIRLNLYINKVIEWVI